MAQSPLYILTAVDARRRSSPTTSRANIITKMVIPPIKFKTVKHDPGGGNGEVNFMMPRIDALEPKFEIKGIDEDIFEGFGEVDFWTFACAYRDKKTGKMLPARCEIEGAITEWEPDESDPSEFQGCSHMFNEITHFEFSLNDKELWYWDFDERETRRNGKSLTDSTRQALGA